MQQSRRPPPGLSPVAFFESWLPQAFSAGVGSASADAPRVRVSLSGSGGGDWDIRVEAGSLDVLPLSGRVKASLPDVWIRQPAADFLVAFSPDPDLPELLPPGWGPLDLLFLDPRDVVLVKQISGRILVEIAGRRRRRWVLDVSVGQAGMAAGRPRATVRVDGATYDGLRQGTMAPLQALLERRLAVEGDRALAMQALMLLGARLARG
jgi:hypothetical protein